MNQEKSLKGNWKMLHEEGKSWNERKGAVKK
jgi:hypothetical protein